jgi:hypothetical protein
VRYYLDTEFNGFGGELISLALVREDGYSLYVIYRLPDEIEPWVAENVIPILHEDRCLNIAMQISPPTGARFIADFLAGDPDPVIITDWPDDIRYFCQAVIVGPGQMVNIPGLKFEMHRVDAYPTTLPGAVQHNAWWDAMALRHLFQAQKVAA